MSIINPFHYSKKTENNPVDLNQISEHMQSHGVFGRSQRQYRLFNYLIEQRLKGTEHKISSYTIAVNVLGRSKSFDPSVNSIVRVEMHNLRKRLDLYSQLQDLYSIKIPHYGYTIIARRKRAKSRFADFFDLIRNLKLSPPKSLN